MSARSIVLSASSWRPRTASMVPGQWLSTCASVSAREQPGCLQWSWARRRRRFSTLCVSSWFKRAATAKR
ncbi:hypothetical protein PF006_g31759 [Phytophthora fragariae]|uniref:Uncharacterized protein n=1 Tax=Phytophthora fragariae TaxID=53985 RepID=A0A6A3PK48_9STRA|nr:hypothetical protein PF006_g31759 [Phytophthora fragariae]